jgi:hypothetical protein
VEFEPPGDLGDNANGHDPLGPKAQAATVEALRRHAISLGYQVTREALRRFKGAVRGGATLENLKAEIDEAALYKRAL